MYHLGGLRSDQEGDASEEHFNGDPVCDAT